MRYKDASQRGVSFTRATAAQVICLAGYAVYISVFVFEPDGAPLTYGASTVVALGCLTLCLWYWGRPSGGAFNLLAIFFLSFTLFTQGQIILFGFGVGPLDVYDVRDYFSEQELCRASIFSSACLLALFHGTLLGQPFAERSWSRRSYDPELLATVMQRCGYLLAIVTLPAFAYRQLTIFAQARSSGYGAIQSMENGLPAAAKILDLATQFFLVAMVLLMIASRQRKRRFDMWMLIFLIYPVALLMAGERAVSTGLIAVALYLRVRYFGAGPARGAVTAAVSVVALMLVFPSLLFLRHNGLVSPGAMWRYVVEVGPTQAMVESIAGVGFSIMPLVETMRLVPSAQDYSLGLSYAAALTSPVPRVGFAHEHSELSRWLMDTLHLTFGPGFSMPAEAYYNFGVVLALPAMVLLGIGLVRVVHVPPKHDQEGLAIVVAVVFVALNVTLPRREIQGMVTDFAWIILPVYLLVRTAYVAAARRSATDRVRVAAIPHE